jgi:predicted Zn-dependent protease
MDTFPSPSLPTRVSRPCAHRLFALAAISVALFSAPPAAAVSEPSLITGQKKSFAYSWQQEVQLGAEADKELTESMGTYDDPKLQAYVQAVGERVLQQSHFASPNVPEIYRNTKFTFRVIDSPVVNAFALPGGYVYVTRGLLAHVQNEAQLAVVLGHEIAHVAARHSSQQANRSKWSQIGLIAGAILGQKVLGDRMPNLAPTLINAGGQALQMFMLRYSREAEHESDNLGVAWANQAGYASGESAKFFNSLQRLAAAEGKALPTWQSTHPDPGDRAKRVVQLAGGAPAGSNANVGEEQFLQQIEGITIGEDPREGFAQNGVFYHPTMRFQFPVAQGWKMENQRAAVIFAEPNGKAMMGLRLAPGARARDAAQQFAQQSKVQVVNSGDTSVNGLPTTVIIAQAETEQGALGIWNAFIEYEGKVYSVLGYAPVDVFNQVRPTFEATAAGFSPLRNSEALNVQPARLRLVRTDRAAPFAAYVPTSLPQELTADHVALLNQMTLNDQVEPGRILKVPDVSRAQPPPQMTPAPTTAQQVPAASQTYPPQTQSTPQAYPAPTTTTYPQQYPNPNYPAGGGYPQTVPQQQPYPPQSSPYPSQPYPPAQGQPPAQNPYPPSSYPPAQTYPPSGTTYPQTYPQSSYPPPNAPQFPQGNPGQAQPTQPGAQSAPPARQPSGPVWPR